MGLLFCAFAFRFQAELPIGHRQFASPLLDRGHIINYLPDDGRKLGEWLKRTSPLEQAKVFVEHVPVSADIRGDLARL